MLIECRAHFPKRFSLSNPLLFLCSKKNFCCYSNQLGNICYIKNANQMLFFFFFFFFHRFFLYIFWIWIMNRKKYGFPSNKNQKKTIDVSIACWLTCVRLHKFSKNMHHRPNVQQNTETLQMATHSPKKKVVPLRRPMLYAPTTQIYQNQMESERRWRSRYSSC